MSDPPTEERWLRAVDVRETFNVSHTTLLRWDESGKLPAPRTPTGHRRWRQFDVEAVRAGRPLPTRDDAGRVIPSMSPGGIPYMPTPLAESSVRPGETAVDGLTTPGGA